MATAFAAQRSWYAVAADGHEWPLVIGIGPALRNDKGVWRVEVLLDPIDRTSHYIHGADGWQATTLAMEFAVDRLRHFVEQGGKLFWERGGTPAEPAELLPGNREP